MSSATAHDRPAHSPLAGILKYDESKHALAYDGLTAFAPMWAVAMTFSAADNYEALLGQAGAANFTLRWVAILMAAYLFIRPRATWALAMLAGAMTLNYIHLLPVESNNKTISFFMNAGMLTVLGVLYLQGRRGDLREAAYERMRPIGRGLLAVMYFYGIFHKINTDFLDPNVSCAVALYQPLAGPFGLADNIYGKYLAIAATFIVETITIVALYWRRFFAAGLLIGLLFHYVIPISAYSWYMDFSALVFALYVLSMPREASARLHGLVKTGLTPLWRRFGDVGTIVPGALLLAGAVGVVIALAMHFPARDAKLLYHSVWVLMWAVVGGVAMVAIAAAVLDFLPYKGPRAPRQPWWVYAFPVVLFVSCFSPYIGLKTESSINMFSNLHTEAGFSNHLLMPKPPYLFDYQNETVEVLDSSHGKIIKYANLERHMVLFAVKEFLRRKPDHWITYRYKGEVYERMTWRDFPEHRPNLLERELLVFKPVDYRRPKVCTH